MRLTNEQLKALASATLNVRPDEIGCDEWLDRVGLRYNAGIDDGQL